MTMRCNQSVRIDIMHCELDKDDFINFMHDTYNHMLDDNFVKHTLNTFYIANHTVFTAMIPQIFNSFTHTTCKIDTVKDYSQSGYV